MAKTVNEAFNEFMKNVVNLSAYDTNNAKNSRKWLVDNIIELPNSDYDFPLLYIEQNIFFGSFERKTKAEILDDIDLMICLSAEGSWYEGFGEDIKIHVPDSATRLKNFCNEDGKTLNSIKVINCFVKKLEKIPQYKKAEIHRDQEAVTLDLQSYDWKFDIVPCFFTKPTESNKTFYIIPDGKGTWKMTDPRLDRERTYEVNNMHGNNIVLNIIRIIKYWNNRHTMPSIGSYLLENMILDYYYSNYQYNVSKFIDLELLKIFSDLASRIYSQVHDPKGIQGNLNSLDYETRKKVEAKAREDYYKVGEAIKFEQEQNYKAALNKWSEIFGDKFPKYED